MLGYVDAQGVSQLQSQRWVVSCSCSYAAMSVPSRTHNMIIPLRSEHPSADAVLLGLRVGQLVCSSEKCFKHQGLPEPYDSCTRIGGLFMSLLHIARV